MDRNETLADIVAEMLELSNHLPPESTIRVYAYRIEAAAKRMGAEHKRELDRAVLNKDFVDGMAYCAEIAKRERETVTNRNGLGDAAKLREAVEGIEMLLGAGGDLDRKDLAEECARALAAPPRNCDVGTPEEQKNRFDEFCNLLCKDCPAMEDAERSGCCELAWGQLPYDAAQEGGPKCKDGMHGVPDCRWVPGYTDKCEGSNRCRIYKEKGKK